MLLRFPEVRGKSETAENNSIFGNKTAGRGSAKPGSGRPISVLPRTSGIAHRSMRQIPGPTSILPLSLREAAGRGVAASRRAWQVLNLPHTSVFASMAARVHLYPRLNNGQNSQLRLHT